MKRPMTRWTWLARTALALGALAAAQGVTAQDEAAQGDTSQAATVDDVVSSDSDREIVVTGKRDPAPTVRAARAQARAITDASNVFDNPLPLFQKPVCPGVSGLPEDLAQYVADRIRYNAERAGLRLAEAGNCSPNLVVSFVLDGQKALAKYAGKGNTILTDIPVTERKALLRDSGPVHAFVVAADRTRDGMRPNRDPNWGYEVVFTQSANSLFLLTIRSDIQMSVVLIDIPAIDGLSAKQLADYATMRGLAKTKPVTGDATYGTILNLFDPDSGHPGELTSFDLGYLKAIYSNSPNLAAAAKLGAVKHEMRKQLEAAEDAKGSAE